MITGVRERHLREELEHRPLGQANAPVRHRAPDRERLVRAVDADRPAVAPRAQHVRERRDAERARTVRTARVREHEALRDVEASARRRRAGLAHRGRRAQEQPAALVEKETAARDVDDDAFANPRRRGRSGANPAQLTVGIGVHPDAEPGRPAASVESLRDDRHGGREPVRVRDRKVEEGRRARAAVDRRRAEHPTRVSPVPTLEPANRARLATLLRRDTGDGAAHRRRCDCRAGDRRCHERNPASQAHPERVARHVVVLLQTSCRNAIIPRSLRPAAPQEERHADGQSVLEARLQRPDDGALLHRARPPAAPQASLGTHRRRHLARRHDRRGRSALVAQNDGSHRRKGFRRRISKVEDAPAANLKLRRLQARRRRKPFTP